MSTTAKKTAKETATKPNPKPAAKKITKPKVVRDRFGSRPKTESGQINAVMTTKPQTIAEITKKTGLSTSRVRNHMRWLINREHVAKSGEGYKLKSPSQK